MNMSELFGCMVFNDSVMQERLPKATYKELKTCIAEDRSLPLHVANVVAQVRAVAAHAVVGA